MLDDQGMKFLRRLGNLYLPGSFLRRFLHKLFSFLAPLFLKNEQRIKYYFSNQKKFVFLKNPLVASQSMHSILHKNSFLKGFDLTERDRHLLAPLNETCRDYKVFCFVRNPWSRVVSCYHKKIVNANTANKLLLLSRHPKIKLNFTFNQFVEFLCSEEGSDFKADEHWVSQHKLLLEKSGQPLYDHVGKLELFPESMESVLGKIGIASIVGAEIGRSEQMKTKKEHEHYQDYFDDDTWEKIAIRYARDIELFGYGHMV